MNLHPATRKSLAVYLPTYGREKDTIRLSMNLVQAYSDAFKIQIYVLECSEPKSGVTDSFDAVATLPLKIIPSIRNTIGDHA